MDSWILMLVDLQLLAGILAPRLGISEEVSWREVYMDDNNNCLQAMAI